MRDPRTATGFDWNDANEEKLAARFVTPDQVERIFENEPRILRNKRGRAGLWLMIGQDPVSGRRLKVPIYWQDEELGILRAVTAFDA